MIRVRVPFLILCLLLSGFPLLSTSSSTNNSISLDVMTPYDLILDQGGTVSDLNFDSDGTLYINNTAPLTILNCQLIYRKRIIINATAPITLINSLIYAYPNRYNNKEANTDIFGSSHLIANDSDIGAIGALNMYDNSILSLFNQSTSGGNVYGLNLHDNSSFSISNGRIGTNGITAIENTSLIITSTLVQLGQRSNYLNQPQITKGKC